MNISVSETEINMKCALQSLSLDLSYMLDGISNFRQLEILPPSCSWVLIPAPTPLLCKLDWGSNYLSRCCFWAVNTFSTSSFLKYGRSRSIFRDTRARGTSGQCVFSAKVLPRWMADDHYLYTKWVRQLQVAWNIYSIERAILLGKSLNIHHVAHAISGMACYTYSGEPFKYPQVVELHYCKKMIQLRGERFIVGYSIC